MKKAEYLTPDGSAPLPMHAGELTEDQSSAVQLGILKNTGDEPLTTITQRVVNDPAKPASLTASIGGVAVGTEPTELLSGPLLPGESLAVTLTWSVPAGTVFSAMDLDTATLEGEVG